jgi:hypothetical protein
MPAYTFKWTFNGDGKGFCDGTLCALGVDQATAGGTGRLRGVRGDRGTDR